MSSSDNTPSESFDGVDVDVAIIGAGSAGLVAYRQAKDAGARVLICDPGPLGTTCARVGCMPSKLLIAAANRHRAVQRGRDLGIEAENIAVNGSRVLDRLREERDRFAGFSVRAVEVDAIDDYLPDAVHFSGPSELRASSGQIVRAKAIVVASGTRPAVPTPLDKLTSSLVTTDSVFEISALPRKLAVVGSGPIGVELAQAFAGLDCEVTLFNRGTSLAGIADPIIYDSFRELLENDVRLLNNTAIESAEDLGGRARLRWKDGDDVVKTEVFDLVLAATGW